ncbi:D-alanyl-D-alanine carboxypeptidase [Thermopetrobacter sp. TC1]|uniref:D-alanyl-D-alanine carboxypeptidase n=1 Tax=Thermopetrobacter sp. TC1 TaxID=1495045 RepID=UPI0018CFA13B|nr:D-alanyl-D-alanine carboxypeptidase [Thermopetrobacter sp. TC1]
MRSVRHVNALWIILLSLVLSLHLLLTQAAHARQGFAAIAVDARSGRVLFARNADSPRIPASVTKVMTIYMLFREIRAGRLSLHSRIRISRHAASMQPSKLWLKPGQTITVDQAIRALVTKSANDVAAAVAEAIAGSERAFARRMTATARAMGMTRTTFRNASGLPYPPNVSTARDLATLALRIQRDFPRLYKRYFALKYFSFRGRTYRNHNRLLWRVRGMDGLKTGYTRAAGYNLAATVRRNGKRVVAVVLGAPSSRMRNAYMARLLERTIRRRDLVRGTRIAAVAGIPPGLSRTQVAALNRATRTTRVASAKKPVRKAPVKPARRPALPSGQLARLAQRALAAGDETSEVKAVMRPPLPRSRPQSIVRLARRDNDTEKTAQAPATRKTVLAEKPSGTEGKPVITEAPKVESAGALFVAVRPEAQKIKRAEDGEAKTAAVRDNSDTGAHGAPDADREQAQAAETNAESESTASDSEPAKVTGAIAMQVRPQPAPEQGEDENGSDEVSDSHAQAAMHGQEEEADVPPARTERKVASLDPNAAFVPPAPARVIKVDRSRREMVVAPVRMPVSHKEAETEEKQAVAAPGSAKASSESESAMAEAAKTEKAERSEKKAEAPSASMAEKAIQQEKLARHLKSWNIQLGAFPAKDGAKKRLEQARKAARRLLRGKPAFTMVFERNGTVYYRARFSGFDRRGAYRACRALKKRRIPCFALAPGAGQS